MTPAQILQWATVGAQLVTVLGVPIARVVQLFKDAGGSDADAVVLVGYWAMLHSETSGRIDELKSQIAAGG